MIPFAKADILRRVSLLFNFQAALFQSKSYLHTLHILSFLLKGAVNVSIQRYFYGTMPQKFTECFDIESQFDTI